MANRSGGRVYSIEGCSPTILSRDFKQPKMIMEEVKIAAMRGRNPENPSERGKSNGKYQQRLEINENGTSNTITSVQKDNLVIEPKTICLNSKVDGKQPSVQDRIYDPEGIATACTTSFHPSIAIPQATKQGYIEVEQGGVFDAAYPESTTRRGRVQEGGKVTPTICTSNELCVYEGVEYKGKKFPEGSGLYTGASDRFQRDGLKDMSRCLKAGISDAGVVQNFRIRKLTPRECYRLMGVTEENIDKIQDAGISNAQQYKMAGNSIVVDVLYHIFRKMFVDKESDNAELTLF